MDPVNDLGCHYVEENDLVSAYLAGRLSEKEAEAFERHYFDCERCWSEVRAGEEIRAALNRGRGKGAVGTLHPGPWTTSRVLALAAAVGIAAAGAVLLLRPGASASRSGIDALASAAGSRRTTEARLTGPFQYGPITRGGESLQTELNLAMQDALARARKEDSAQNLHAAGLAYLLANDTKEAVPALEKAAAKAPGDGGILSDLAAAYLTRAVSPDKKEGDFGLAFERAGKALELDPNLAPARFNAALALEGLGQRAQAQKAWEAYLAIDPKSGWADEARARIKALSAPPQSELWRKERERLDGGLTPGPTDAEALARRFPQQVRQYIEDELLPRWGDARSPAEAVRSLNQARALAVALLKANGEGLSLDAVEEIDSSDNQTTMRLGEAYRLFGRARRDYKAAEIADALDLYRRTEAEASAAESRGPLVDLAQLGQASCHLYGASGREAAPLVRSLAAAIAAPGSRRLALRGQTIWLDGLVQEIAGHPYESLESYRQALEIFTRLGENENVAGLHGGIAAQLKVLGRSDEAWSYFIAQLSGLDEGAPTARLTNAHGDVVRESLDRGYTRLALLSDAEEVRVSDARKAPLFMTYSRLWKAQTAESLGDLPSAKTDLAAARVKSKEISDPGTRERAEAEIELSNVRIAGRGNPQEAFASADRAVFAAERADNRGRLPELLWIRGRLRRELGHSDLALKDFLRGIDALEAARGEIKPADLRISYFETSRSLFDGAIGLEVAAGRDAEAFLLADRAHGRAVLDSVRRANAGGGRESSAHLTVRELRDWLDPDTALVEYWVSDSRTQAWVVRRDGFAHATLALTTSAAEASVAGLLKQLEEPRGDSADTEKLYDAVIRPLASYLQGAASIAFVPDGPLHGLPFAPLRDSERSRLLVEDYASWVAPSAAYLVARPRPKPVGRAPRVLVIASPAFDRARFPDLPPLRGAEAEADAILSVFPNATVLRGKNATRSAFLRLAPQYDVIHYAGHAVIDETHPEYSALVLAPDAATGDSGVLYAHEIVHIDLHASGLIVLAGCGTGFGRSAQGEGLLSIGRSFLEAGAGQVMASRSPLRDRDVPPLVRTIYLGIASTQSTKRVLQVALLEDFKREPETGRRLWAAFQLSGL